MLSRILVGLNGTSHTEAVLHHALELGVAHQAHMEGLSFLLPHDYRQLSAFARTGSQAAAHAAARHEDHAERLAARRAASSLQGSCREHDLPCRILPEASHPLHDLVRSARFADLVVVGPGGWSELEHIDDPLTHLSEIVRAGIRPLFCCTNQHHPVESVVFALSATTASCRALRRLVGLRPWPTAAISVIHVGQGAEARVLVEEAAGYCRAAGWTVDEARVLGGDPAQQLIEVVDFSQVLVLGDSSHGRLHRALFGDVTLELLRAAPCPILIV